MVPSEEFLHLKSFAGGLQCVLSSLEDPGYILMFVLRGLFFLVLECDSRHDNEDVRFLDCASVPPPPCFSRAQLDLALCYSLPLSSLSLFLNTLDVSYPSWYHDFASFHSFRTSSFADDS